MYIVNPHLTIPGHEVWFEFSHASGPGGQHVNKASTRATLCFALDASGSLDDFQRRRIRAALGRRIGRDGVLRVACGVAREQTANRRLAGERFCTLLRLALTPRARRVETRPSRGAVRRRRDDKARRSAVKQNRRAPPPDDD